MYRVRGVSERMDTQNKPSKKTKCRGVPGVYFTGGRKS